MAPPNGERPLDSALRQRLRLSGDGRLALGLVRGAITAIDGLSTLTSGRSFFALRQSEAILTELAGLDGVDKLARLMQLNGGTTVVPHGLDHIPTTGPVIVASTHPTGLMEFFAHMTALLALRPDVRVVANQDTEWFLGPDLIVPVQINKQNRAAGGERTRALMRDHLDRGGALLVFGSGRVADRPDGHLVEPEWRGGPTQMSQACDAPVIPAALDAFNSPGYYRTRAVARFLSGGNDHFGAMIGSLRYPEEFLAKLGQQFDTYYGPAQPPGTARETLKRAAEGLVPGLYTADAA